jgi:hypothetical protein
MTAERSQPITSQDEAREWALALMNRQLVGVRYRNAPVSGGPDRNWSGKIHEVDMDVIMMLDDGSSPVISWAMDGLVEGLGLRMLHSSAAAPLRNGSASWGRRSTR